MTNPRSIAWMKWYNSLNPERKADYNFKRNQIQKIKRKKGWLNEDKPYARQAYAHQYQIKKRYPNIYAVSTITTKILVDWLKEHRGKSCSYCGNFAFHIDHIIPLSRKGMHELDNLQIVCEACNIAKNNQTEQEFLNQIKRIYNNKCNILASCP